MLQAQRLTLLSDTFRKEVAGEQGSWLVVSMRQARGLRADGRVCPYALHPFANRLVINVGQKKPRNDT
jgi:hypothetical protein